MNVFDELIEELKEEKLLEETVMDRNRTPYIVRQTLKFEPAQVEIAVETAAVKPPVDPAFVRIPDEILDDDSDLPEIASPIDRNEFFRKRAMEEMASLQMVEHVLSGIEREHMKTAPAVHDDLAVKKALHKFLQVSSDITSDEHAEADYAFRKETENWCAALAQRDSNVSVANVRRFCEISKPVLSSQALMALARFYRNAPYSEAVRGKFDFVMTRLFSRELDDAKRNLLFGRLEMTGHIKTLYSNWSSIALYNQVDDETLISAAISRFDEFVSESDRAETFDSLIASDFFNRIRLFKEQTNVMFFTADVVGAAINCNVRIGNRYVELIKAERERNNGGNLEEKYGYTYDTVISNAASKTLLLVELLKEEKLPEIEKTMIFDEPLKDVSRKTFERAPVYDYEKSRSGLLGVNIWLLAATVLTVTASVGIYFWAENVAVEQSPTAIANSVDMGDSPLKQHLKTVSSSEETLYGFMQPTWDTMTDDEKEQFLKDTYEFAVARGLKKVNLLSERGRTVGYASEKRIDIFGP